MRNQYLQRSRHGTHYYFRRRVPSDIQRLTGKRQIYKSLVTTDRREAIIRARALAVQTDQLFTRIRAMPQQDWNRFNIGYTLKVEFNDQGRISSLALDAEPHEQEAAQKALETVMVPPVSVAEPESGAPPQEALTVAEGIVEFIGKCGLKPSTLASYRTKLAHVQAFFGRDAPLFSIDQRAFVAFAEHVKSDQSRSGETQGDYITIAGTFLKWHRVRAGLPLLTAATLKPKQAAPQSNSRDAFSAAQLESLFRNAASYRVDQPHKFWVTIAVAFLGCRLEELAQIDLTRDLLRDETSGIWYLDLNELPDADGIRRKSMKRKASWRRIPIHSALIAHGFIDFLKAQASKGATRPFELSWPPHMDKNMGTPKWNHAISKWGGGEMNRMVMRGQLERGKLTYFHSLRHTFASTLANVDVSEEHRAAIQGQELGGINSNVYAKLKQNVSLLSGVVERGLVIYEVALNNALRKD
jgi:integrase